VARVDVPVPPSGESISEGVVTTWRKRAGEWVARGEPLLELETDKANLEVESPVDGVLVEARAVAGQTVRVGEVVAVIDTTASGWTAPEPKAPAERETRCPRCGERMERANAPADALPLAVRLLVCRACGRVEMFAEDPRTF
jgi:pyruvate/2-oxoglutarate dehydrogenase complex dihydrolipoamide acyltransferase (E2) component